MVAILTAGLIATSWLGRVHKDVLGYATDMSIQSLLNDTNEQRANNDEGNLQINSELNQAAQAKANDMAARNYWSHNTPDGQTPWSFITAAGYDYQTAGENLAYGFATAGDTVTGWMNSPEHRANILNATYHDVGFGFINISDYQSSGPETLVVAMYGSLASESVAAATPAPAQSVPTPAPATSSPAPAASPHASTPAPQAAPTPTPNPAIATQRPPSGQPVTTHQSSASQPSQERVTQLQLVSSNTPMNTVAISMLGIAACGFLVLRHGLGWRKVVLRGERFIFHHPLLDIAAVTLVSLAIVLTHTAGLII